jgi:hypothetical protein
MALKNISIGTSDVISTPQDTPLTLAAMYLVETLNEGSCIEIPSLGVALCRERTLSKEKEPEENGVTKP